MARFQRALIVEQSEAYMRQVRDMLDGLCDKIEYCYDGQTALRRYDRMKPDLLLVEAILPKHDGFSILEHAIDSPAIKIMLTSVNHEMIVRKAFELKADYLFVKPYHKESFVMRLLEIADFKRQAEEQYVLPSMPTLQSKVADLLKMLGIPVNIKGSQYLRECLLAVCADRRLMDRMRENLYQPTAERHDTSSKCVERNIRHAIEVSSLRGDADTYLKCFGYSIHSEKGKPTNKEFIAALADEILAQNNESRKIK